MPTASISLTTSLVRSLAGMRASLSWSGATTSTVDIYRNGSRVATVSNSGLYRQLLSARGTYVYKVCNAGSTAVCSNSSTLVY